MKTKHALLYSACQLVLILIGLAACTDHLTLPGTPGSTVDRLRVKSLTLALPNNQSSVSLLRYDAQNRLSSILIYQTPDSTVAPVEYSTYQYDSQNRLTQFRREIVLRPTGSSPNLVEQYDYRYNAAGQVEGVSHPSGYSATFRYNGNQLVSSVENFSIPVNISYNESNQFTFSGGNLTTTNSTTRIVLRGPLLETTSTLTSTYDNKRNPFFGIYIIPAPYAQGFFNPNNANFSQPTYYGGFGNQLNLSMNNRLTSNVSTTSNTSGTPTNTSTSYQYTYNTADLPITRQTTVNGAVTETLRFEYEPY